MDKEKKVYFLGPVTSYTDVAKEYFKQEFNLNDYADEEKKTITAVIISLCNTDTNDVYGVLPIENSIEGIVKESIDNISKASDSGIKILAECIIPIEHCLIGYTKNKNNIKTIISHPQAISQCFNYLYDNFGDNIVYKSETSTACAVKNINNTDTEICAIGSKTSADFFNKPIIETNINDEKYNQTRFLLLGKQQLPKTNSEYKTSITFATENKSGALCEILKILEKYNINMSHISSRPSRKNLGEYIFYIDFDGKMTDDTISKATFEILQHVKMFKHLGSYPKAKI